MENSDFIKMYEEEYDEFICGFFPQLFAQRHLDESVTCMCWGINIPKGWYFLLYELCRKLDVIRWRSEIPIEFGQIKTKFSLATLIVDIDKDNISKRSSEEKEIWKDIIYYLVNSTENSMNDTCPDCGESIHSKGHKCKK